MKIQNRLSNGFISQTWCYRIRASPPSPRTTYSIACFQLTIQYASRQLVGEERSVRWAKQTQVYIIHSPWVASSHSLWITGTHTHPHSESQAHWQLGLHSLWVTGTHLYPHSLWVISTSTVRTTLTVSLRYTLRPRPFWVTSTPTVRIALTVSHVYSLRPTPSLSHQYTNSYDYTHCESQVLT